VRIGLITARGGSKGLPRKNILPLLGEPLIAWTLRAALGARSIDAVFVSTEDAEIAAVSEQYGALVIPRPAELSQDDTGSEPVIAHALEYLATRGEIVEEVFLLQPTSPLRVSQHIDDAFELFTREQAACVISVYEPRHTPAKAYKVNADRTISGLVSDSAPYARRQDLPRAVQPNGAIYLFHAASFMENRQIPRTQVLPFMMTPTESVDIDTAEDLALAAQLLETSHG
jgi:CMP-N,N'-diacetyllegionaminic acid synthase